MIIFIYFIYFRVYSYSRIQIRIRGGRAMEELERFEFELCECTLGAHVEVTATLEGSWVRFEDVARLLGVE